MIKSPLTFASLQKNDVFISLNDCSPEKLHEGLVLYRLTHSGARIQRLGIIGSAFETAPRMFPPDTPVLRIRDM